MKDNIIDGDIIWTAECSPGFYPGSIRLDNSDRKSERFLVESFDVATLGLIYITVLGVAYSPKIGK